MEFIIYVLSIIIIPLFIVLKLFKVQVYSFGEDKQVIEEDKSFSNVNDLKILSKKIQLIFVITTVIACNELTNTLNDVSFKIISACLIAYLTYQSLERTNGFN